MKKDNIRYYSTYQDDFIESDNQSYEVKDNYKWIHNNIIYKTVSVIISIPFLIFGFIYTKFILHISYKNKKVLKHYKRYFVYANHTQPIGDAFVPSTILFPKKPKIIVSSANLGIKVIGKFLPMLGALPIPNNIHKMKEFTDTIDILMKKNNIIFIYPEAHVWEYCTFIREFSNTSFRFPIINNVPSFTMTTTYQKRLIGKKPKITIYFDGPFYSNNLSTLKEKSKDLHDKVYNSLVKNSKHSTYEYIKYVKKDEI